MEDKMAWRRVHAELVENHRLAQEMSATLAKSRACSAELLSCLTAAEDGGEGEWRWPPLGNSFLPSGINKLIIVRCFIAAGGSSGVAELVKKMASHEEELGKTASSSVVFVSSAAVFFCADSAVGSFHHHSGDPPHGASQSEATQCPRKSLRQLGAAVTPAGDYF